MNKKLQPNRFRGILAVLLLGIAPLALQAQTPTSATGQLVVSPPPAARSVAEAPAVLFESGTTTAAESAMANDPDQLRFNFQGVPLDAVLDYMSRAAGFVIVREVNVAGRVDVVSHQTLSRPEAVALLDTVLNSKGYAAIRQGRNLTIVNRNDARYHPIPVIRGADPEKIPTSDQIVTQIIPVGHAKVKELLADLQPLLPEWATISANEASNAVVLTDTQTNIRRMVEIISKLDESITMISSIKVYQLKFADAKETAELIKGIFSPQQAGSGNQNNPFVQMLRQGRGGRGGGGGPGGFFGGGDEGGGGANVSTGDSVALQAASRVTAVSDSRTNSLIISAPEELIPSITELVNNIDHSTDVMTVVRVFFLRNSDAELMATNINNVFGKGGQTGVAQFGFGARGGRGAAGGRGGRGAAGGRGAFGIFAGAGNTTTDLSERKLAENTVVAVADTRTNSLVVSAVSEVMDQIAQVIAELDQNSANTKDVYVYKLENADAASMATMLQSMFATNTRTGNTNRNTTNRTTGSSANQRNAQQRGNTGSGNSGFGSGSSGFGSNTGGRGSTR